MVVTLPVRTISEANVRCHWATKMRRVKAQRSAAGLVAAGVFVKLGRPFPLEVTLCRIAPRALDDDNLRGALKAVRDGVADALGVDDRDCRVSWAYQQRRGAPGAYSVEIGIRARPEASSGQQSVSAINDGKPSGQT